jgi:pyrroloquinoline quinone biosynthesis protein B
LVVETIAYLKNEDISLKNKVYFIHMNHTNPMLDENSEVSKLIFNEGFNIARLGYQFEL